MKDTADTRPLGQYGNPNSPPRMIRVRGVHITTPSDTIENRALRWKSDDDGYEETSEVVTFYAGSSTTPRALAEDEETFVVWRPAAKRYEEIQGATINQIRATVYADAITTDPTVAATGAVVRKGSGPSSDPFSFVNQFAKAYSTGDKVWLLQGDDGNWYPDQTASGTGSTIARFELTQNKAKSDTAKQAKPVNDAGAIISGADPVYLVDPLHRFMGKIAADADSDHGYQFDAEYFTSNYTGGVPGWRIIAGEGPAEFFVGTVVSPPSGDSTVTIDSNDVPGAPDRGRLPKEDEDGHITVVDDLSIADDTDTGDKWVFKYDETADHYIFWFKISHTDDFRIIKFAAPTSLSPSDTTFTVSSYSVVQGTLPTGTLTIHNDLPIRCNSGDTLYARWNKTIPGWDVNDEGNEEHHLRGKDDYDYTKVMVLESNSGAFHWVESGACS